MKMVDFPNLWLSIKPIIGNYGALMPTLKNAPASKYYDSVAAAVDMCSRNTTSFTQLAGNFTSSVNTGGQGDPRVMAEITRNKLRQVILERMIYPRAVAKRIKLGSGESAVACKITGQNTAKPEKIPFEITERIESPGFFIEHDDFIGSDSIDSYLERFMGLFLGDMASVERAFSEHVIDFLVQNADENLYKHSDTFIPSGKVTKFRPSALTDDFFAKIHATMVDNGMQDAKFYDSYNFDNLPLLAKLEMGDPEKNSKSVKWSQYPFMVDRQTLGKYPNNIFIVKPDAFGVASYCDYGIAERTEVFDNTLMTRVSANAFGINAPGNVNLEIDMLGTRYCKTINDKLTYVDHFMLVMNYGLFKNPSQSASNIQATGIIILQKECMPEADICDTNPKNCKDIVYAFEDLDVSQDGKIIVPANPLAATYPDGDGNQQAKTIDGLLITFHKYLETATPHEDANGDVVKVEGAELTTSTEISGLSAGIWFVRYRGEVKIEVNSAGETMTCNLDRSVKVIVVCQTC